MSGGGDTLPDPPHPPELPRRLSLYRFQLIGLPFLVVIPLLALTGVFGERWRDAHARDGALEVSARYPSVFRYKMINAIELSVRNRGETVIDSVTVSLDTAYADGFSTITAVPAFTGAFNLELTRVQPGASRRVRIEIQAERYWSHTGDLTVAAAGDTVRVPLTTFIFP